MGIAQGPWSFKASPPKDQDPKPKTHGLNVGASVLRIWLWGPGGGGGGGYVLVALEKRTRRGYCGTTPTSRVPKKLKKPDQGQMVQGFLRRFLLRVEAIGNPTFGASTITNSKP